MIGAPGLFLLSRPWEGLLASALLAHAAWRAATGIRVLRYRANLRRQRRYELTSTEIPWSAKNTTTSSPPLMLLVNFSTALTIAR